MARSVHHQRVLANLSSEARSELPPSQDLNNLTSKNEESKESPHQLEQPSLLESYLFSSKQQRNQQTARARSATKPLAPVILVPGYGGSRLEAKINKQQVKHYFCERHTGDQWKNIWIDVKLMLPYMIDCLIDDFRLEFDAQTNTTHNTQGVDIRVCKPQDLSTVEYLTDFHLSSFGYFAAIIRKLINTFGYERDVNLRGAPYDFRKAPNELASYFKQLKATCEKMYAQARGKPISFICHSMGCNNVLYFLQRQNRAWKAKFVRRVVSLAAPWGGSMQAVRATAFGDNLGLPYLFDEAELKIVQQSVPSTMYLYPSVRAFKDAPLIKTHTRSTEATAAAVSSQAQNEIDAVASYNETLLPQLLQEPEVYTARDFKRFFEGIKHPNGYLMWLNTKDLLRSLQAPGVEVNCFYGQGHSTLARMEFEGEFPNSQERDYYTDGDGTVAVQSSAGVCQDWSTEQKQPVTLKAFYANHVEMMKDPEVLSAIEEIVNQENQKTTA